MVCHSGDRNGFYDRVGIQSDLKADHRIGSNGRPRQCTLPGHKRWLFWQWRHECDEMDHESAHWHRKSRLGGQCSEDMADLVDLRVFMLFCLCDDKSEDRQWDLRMLQNVWMSEF